MPIFDSFPYTDCHTLNLDWMLSVFKNEVEPASQLVKDVPGMRDEVAADADIVVNAKDVAVSAKDAAVSAKDAAVSAKDEVESAIATIPDDYSLLSTSVNSINDYMEYTYELLNTSDTNQYHKNNRWNIQNATLVSAVGVSAIDINLDAGKYICCFYGDYSCLIDGSTHTTLYDRIVKIKYYYKGNKKYTAALLNLEAGRYLFTISDDDLIKPFFIKSDSFYGLDVFKDHPFGKIETSGLLDGKMITVAADGAGDFTKFSDGLAEAMRRGNCTLFVKAGDYDIIAELGGYNYTESISAESSYAGLKIGNNVKIFSEHNARLIANYMGANKNMKDNFSVLNVIGSCEMHNISISCENIRYCVHEDVPLSDSSNRGYTIVYDNCTMFHAGTNSTTYIAPACIGAGCWKNSISIIRGGWYKCNSAQILTPISYHNYDGTGESLVIVDNVMFERGQGVKLYGFKTGGSFIRCRMSNSLIGRETEKDGATDRIVLTEWGNTMNQ